MKIVGRVCESGGRKMSSGRLINEDCLIDFSVKYMGEQYNFVIQMDGATGLGDEYQIVEGYTSAEWYVSFMVNEIKKILEKEPTSDLESVVDKCILKATKAIDDFEKDNNITLEEYQKPSASLAILRTDGFRTDVFLLGDSQTIVAYSNGMVTTINNPNQEVVQNLENGVLSKMAELAEANGCNLLDTRESREIEEILSKNRSKKNAVCEGGYWVCGTTPNSAKHGVSVTFENADITGLILASDGFNYQMLDLDEEQTYNLVLEKGVETVTRLIREKQEEDAMCNKYPRFKKSDDLTVVHFDYM